MINNKTIVKIIAYILLFAGLAVIIGWIFNIEVLKSVFSGFVTMKFSAAVGFMLSGIVLHLMILQREGKGSKLLLIILVVSMITVSVLISAALVGININLVNLIVKEAPGAVNTTYPGVPPAIAIFNFGLMTLAGFLSAFGIKSRRIYAAIGILIGLVGITALAGYILKIPMLYFNLPGISTAIAVHGAVLFVLMGLGLILLCMGKCEDKPANPEKTNLSFRMKFSLSILLVAIIIGLVAIYILTSQGRTLLTSYISAKTEQLSDYTKQLTDLSLEGVTGTLQDLSDDSDIISLLENGDGASFNSVEKKLTDAVRYRETFNNAAIYDNACILRGGVASTAGLVGQSFAERDYCIGIKKTGQTYISGALWGVVSQKPILTVSVPVRNANGEMIGFVFGSINIDRLKDALIKLEQPGEKIGLLDRYNSLFLDTAENLTKILPAGQLPNDTSAVVDRINAGQDKGFFQFTEEDGRDNFVAYKKYDYVTIIFDSPYSETFGVINALDNTIYFAVIAAILLAMIASWIVAGILVGPVKKISRQIDEITKGKLDLELEKSNTTEINMLVNSLNRILASLKLAILRTGATKGELGIAEAMEAKKEAEDKYKILYETSADAIMTIEAPDWKFTAGNPATLKMFNIKNEEELKKLGPWDLSPEKQPNGKLSAVMAKKEIMEAVKKGSSFFNWTHKRYKGENFEATVLLTKAKINGKDVVQATVRDISGKTRARLRKQLKQRRSLNSKLCK